MTQPITESKLREWMDKAGPRLITISASICRDRHVAEEIVQEAFVKLWQKPPEVGEVAYTSWLRRVVTNLSINALQRTKRTSPLPEYATDKALQTSQQPGAKSEMDEGLKRVQDAMGKLDESKRAILTLRAHEQLSYDEIALHLGVPVGTVMSRLNRARSALMQELKQADSDSNDNPMVFDIRKYKRA